MPYKKYMDDRLFNRLVRVRRQIHRWPEPAFEERKTGDVIAKYLDRLSVPYRRGVARTGIVAILDKHGPGAPTVALRADMDALPIEEKTGLPFSSKVKGHMHACGHDGHVAIALGAATLLKKSPPDGNVVFLFQPAEEGKGGARSMIKEGALKGVDMIFGGHIDVGFNLGEVAIRTGVETSYTDGLEIKVLGKGGHAARPHESVDAVVVASLFVIALQNIVSRSINPLNPTVITIGSIRAGTVYNAIADEATLMGTVRNTDGKTRKHVLQRIQKTADALASLHDARIEVNITEGYPPVVNHPEGYELAREAAEDLIGKERVINLSKPSMGGEDFAFYLKKVPGCFVRFGAVGPVPEAPAAHSSLFNFDEEVIRLGAVFFDRLARKALGRIKEKKTGDRV
jgi:hippurate hydrolase